jgi:hypothetical protein
MSDSQQKSKDLGAITLQLNEIVKSIGTIQGQVHQVVVMGSIYAYKYNDADIISTILNNLSSVRGSFRVESVAYWFKHIAGLNPTFNEKLDKYTTKFCKAAEYASAHGVTFTFDKVHVAILKDEKYRFWKIAPVTIKELKLQDDIEKATASAEIQLARSYAAGHINQAALILHISKMTQRIISLAETGKTKEWLEEFYTQHPSEKPVVEVDAIEAELKAEELEELEVDMTDAEFSAILKTTGHPIK